MLNIDADRLTTVAQTAWDAAEGTKDGKRWQNAIAKAVGQLDRNPYIAFEPEGTLILSESNEIYRANGTCQCKAWTSARYPCWHRALHRLLVRLAETSH
jgi:hypothetical protein